MTHDTPTTAPTTGKNGKRRRRQNNGNGELDHVPILEKPLAEIRPSPENDTLYRPVDPNDPEIIELARSIWQFGVREPLVLTLDGYILSGHRRFAAAKLAGLKTVPCRIENSKREDDIDRHVLLLREYNRQRDKSLAEKLREEIVNADPRESHRALTEFRQQQSQLASPSIDIRGLKSRAAISAAKRPFLDAVIRVLNGRRAFWPLSDRSIHYALLNDPPLRHASKPDSRYGNTGQSYKSLVDLLTRGRLDGSIPWAAIADPTRPVTTWDVWPGPRPFIRNELNSFLKGYYRNLMQSQPNHVEIVGEKNTIASILKPVAMEYTIPLTIGRGYCSLPPRYVMYERYRLSGKDKLVLLIVSDFDPDGEEIAHSFARSMRDDFGIDEVHPVKVALTGEQVRAYGLPPQMTAKESSRHHDRFVAQHGKDVFEVEALDPDRLQQILLDAIDSVIDVDAFNAEVDAETQDAAFLDGVRATVHEALARMNWDDDGIAT